MRLDRADVADPPELGPHGRADVVDFLVKLGMRLDRFMRRSAAARQTAFAG